MVAHGKHGPVQQRKAPCAGPGMNGGEYYNPCKVERCDFPTPESQCTRSESSSCDRVDHYHENVHHHTVDHYHHEANQIYTKEIHHYEETDYIHPTEREDLCDGGASTQYVSGNGNNGGCGPSPRPIAMPSPGPGRH